MTESPYQSFNPRAPRTESAAPRTNAPPSVVGSAPVHEPAAEAWDAWADMLAGGTTGGEYVDPELEAGLRHIRTSPIPPPMPPSERPLREPLPAAGESGVEYTFAQGEDADILEDDSPPDDDADDSTDDADDSDDSGDADEDGDEDEDEDGDESEDEDGDEEEATPGTVVPLPAPSPEGSAFPRRPRAELPPPTHSASLRAVPTSAPAPPPGREAFDMPPVVPPAETLPGDVVRPPDESPMLPPRTPLPSSAVREAPGTRRRRHTQIQRELAETLTRVGLTGMERDALLQQAEDNDVIARALVRLSGMARVTHESSAGQVEDIDNLRQEGAAARESGITANAIRFLHNLPGETALAERLMDAVSRMQVMEQGFQLKDGNGRPRILGVVAAASLWYFKEIPRSSRDVKNSPWSQYTGTGVEFLNQLLGWNREADKTIRIPVDNQPMEVANNDWLCIALETELEGTNQTVHLLTPASVSGSNVDFDTPADSEVTRFRILQGLLDGLAVRRPDGSMLTISDPLASAPLVLSRNFVPRRGKNDTCPSDTTELRESLKAQGITLACGSRAIWYLEPSWMAMRSGLFPVQPTSPEGVPGTPEFQSWLDSARRRNIERFRDRLMPKRELLQLLLTSGEGGINLDSVARILDTRDE